MARTNYALTSDSSTTSYPDDSAWPAASSTSTFRYDTIGATNRTFAYPSRNDEGFNIPNLRFIFMDAYAQKVPGTPIINLQVPNMFNVTSLSDYSRTENIFGGGQVSDINFFSDIARAAGAEKYAGDAAATADRAVVTAAEAFQYAVKKGLASTLGFAESMGLNNLNQYEFSRRQAVNPMAQLLYKGPQFRRYQLPVTFRPKNVTDSENVKKIISIFRVASSPSVPSTSGVLGSVNIGAGQSFTFGYPHLTQFSAYFMNPDASGAKRIFRSLPCIIESVSVDYGTQKMTFFENGFPTEMNFNIQLTEIMPRTLGDSITDSKDNEVTLM